MVSKSLAISCGTTSGKEWIARCFRGIIPRAPSPYIGSHFRLLLDWPRCGPFTSLACFISFPPQTGQSSKKFHALRIRSSKSKKGCFRIETPKGLESFLNPIYFCFIFYIFTSRHRSINILRNSRGFTKREHGE